MTRTKNSFFNFITGVGSTLLIVILNFITRSVFVRFLGTSYLGIEGLFSNILTMLSLAELGIGSAIVFKLYKPIEEGDRQRILVLTTLYRNVYRIIGLVVLVIGLCLIPFLPSLIKDYSRMAELGLNAALVFLIYLSNSVLSYWVFAYKSVFVQASQKSYLLNTINYGVSVLNSVCQIVALTVFHSFLLYAAVPILCTVVRNLLYGALCDKRYPYINEKTDEHLSKEETRGFVKDCSVLLLYRAHSIVLNATDNIVLSAMVGLDVVGLYANYLSIKISIRDMLSTFSTAIQASLGSLYSTGNLDWSRLIFRVTSFVSFWLFGIGAIGLSLLTDDFLTIWLGAGFTVTSWTANGVTVATPIALLIGIELYTTGHRYYCDSFRNAMGLFQQFKLRPIASILINLVITVLTVPRLGIAGCIIGTIVATMTTNLLIDPIVICKHGLQQSAWPFFCRNLAYVIAVVLAGFLCRWVCGLIALTGLVGFLVHGCVCVALPCVVFTVCFFWTTEFKYMISTLLELLPERLRGGPKD